MKAMTKTFALFIALALSAPLCASLPIPTNLRNPFEFPDTTAASKLDASGRRNAKNDKEAAREAAFKSVEDQLFSMPVRGIVTNMKDAASGQVTILFGEYTIRNETQLPAADFKINGTILVSSVSTTRIVFKVTIDLDSKEITIPLAR